MILTDMTPGMKSFAHSPGCFARLWTKKGTSAAGAEKNSCLYFPAWIWRRFSFLSSDLLDDIRHTPVLYERKLIHVTMTFGSRRIWQKSYHGICHSGSRPQALSRQREWAEPGDLLILCHLTHPVDFRSFSEEIKNLSHTTVYTDPITLNIIRSVTAVPAPNNPRCNRQCAKRIKYGLPCISCRITHTNSTDHPDIRIHGFR